MAETFKNQVDALTGFGNTEDDALSDWLTAGARTIFNILPENKLERVASNTNFTDSLDVEGKKILSVLRKDASNSNRYMSCRKLLPSQMGTVHDSSYMEYATTNDPAYIVHNDVLNTFPQSVASNDSRVVYINAGITVAHGDSSITNFPDEAEHAVVLHASRNALQRLMNNIQSNSDITTALTAVNTELDETQAICDLINTQVDASVAEIAETVTNVDDNVDTALTAMNTSADKINAAVELANGQFDQAVLESAQAEGEADDSAVATALGLINTQIDAAVALITSDPGVKDRLAAAEVNISNAATEIGLAKAEAAEIATQTDNSGDFETALDAINTELDKVDEIIVLASTEFDKVDNVIVEGSVEFDKTDAFLTNEDTELVSSAVSAGSAYLQESQAIVGNGNAFIQEAQAVISQAQGYAAEVSARSTFTGAKGQAVQSYINTAQAYIAEAQSNIALSNGYNSAVGAYINAAQGYASEIQAYISTTQMFINTASNRINAGNAFLAEANARTGEVNTYGVEVQQRLSQVGAQGQVAASYIAAAQGYANEIQSKISITSGYLQEMQGRLAVDNAKYTWYTQQYQIVDAQYKEQIQTLQGRL